MKRVIAVLMVLATFGMVFAQQGTSSLTDPDPTIIGADSAKQALREVSVDLFEREGSWNARISSDNGVISSRLFDGSPASKEPMAENEGVTDERVLGVKVEFFRRGVNSFYVTAARPIPIEGITKTVSLFPIAYCIRFFPSLVYRLPFSDLYALLSASTSTLVRRVHQANTPLPILVTPSPITTPIRFSQK